MEIRLEMAANTPAMEAGELERVRNIRATRLREALVKRRQQVYQQLRQMMRANFVLFICGIALAAFFYHRWELHYVAANTASAMSSKLETAENSTRIHQAIVSEQQNVDLASDKQ